MQITDLYDIIQYKFKGVADGVFAAETSVNTDFIPRVSLNGKTFTVLNCAVKVFFIFKKERSKKCH